MSGSSCSARSPDSQTSHVQAVDQAERQLHDLADVRLVVDVQHRAQGGGAHGEASGSVLGRSASRRTVASKCSTESRDFTSAACTRSDKSRLGSVALYRMTGGASLAGLVQRRQQVQAGAVAQRRIQDHQVEALRFDVRPRLRERMSAHHFSLVRQQFLDQFRQRLVVLHVQDTGAPAAQFQQHVVDGVEQPAADRSASAASPPAAACSSRSVSALVRARAVMTMTGSARVALVGFAGR